MSDESGSFREFCNLCDKIEAQSQYNEKTKIVKEYLQTFTYFLTIFNYI